MSDLHNNQQKQNKMKNWKIDGEKPEKLGRVLGDDLGWSIDIDFGGKNNFCNIYRNTEKEALETANLITAAPEMLEALQEVQQFLGHIELRVGDAAFADIWNVVEEAIDKAQEGGASC